MVTVYVARSRSLEEWAGDVGLTRHVYLVGVCDTDAEEAIVSLNAARYAGRTDWALVKDQAVDADLDEATARAMVARRETPVDPKYYPQIRGAHGVFKVKPANAENWLMVTRALAGEQIKLAKLSIGDIGAYLIRLAAEEPASGGKAPL